MAFWVDLCLLVGVGVGGRPIMRKVGVGVVSCDGCRFGATVNAAEG